MQKNRTSALIIGFASLLVALEAKVIPGIFDGTSESAKR
jgi:hypothetical protein